MILIALALICMLTVPLTGGRLSRLAGLPLRWLWTAPAALILQVAITEVVPNANHNTLAAVHIISYVLVIAFLIANRSITGMPIIAVGALSNALVIVANGGVMAASARAQQIAGVTLSDQFHNSVVLADPRVLFLGDIIPVPGPLPNVLSPGDCVIFLGMLVVLHAQCHRRRKTSAVSEDGIVLAEVTANAGLVTGNLAMASLAEAQVEAEAPKQRGRRRKSAKAAVVLAESVDTEASAKKGLLRRKPRVQEASVATGLMTGALAMQSLAAQSSQDEVPVRKGFLRRTPKPVEVAFDETPMDLPLQPRPKVGMITGSLAMESLAAQSAESEIAQSPGFADNPGLVNKTEPAGSPESAESRAFAENPTFSESSVLVESPAFAGSAAFAESATSAQSVGSPEPVPAAKKGFLKKAPKNVVVAEEAREPEIDLPRSAVESYSASFGIGGIEVSAPQVAASMAPVTERRATLPDVLPRDEKMLAAQRVTRLTWQAGALGAAIGFFLTRRKAPEPLPDAAA